ncbi:hypothetical protein BGZ73_005899 [Actinomortierella ambigua]|nr:hypothetical protein BGZ73_005899 [Actinomortierella ambigua]
MSSLLQLPNGLNVNSIKNLIFDLGNVVVDIDPGASEALFTKLGATNFPNLPPNVHPQFVTGNINAQHFRAVARTSFGLPGIVTDAEFDHAWSAPILAIPRDRLELLEELRGNSGYKVYVLSNSDPILTERLNKIHLMHHNQYPLDSLFDKIFYSFEIGCRKPDEEAYKQPDDVDCTQ